MWPIVLLALGLYGAKRYFDARKGAHAAPEGFSSGAPLAPAPSDQGGGGGGPVPDGYVPPPAAPLTMGQMAVLNKEAQQKAVADRKIMTSATATSPTAQQSVASRLALLPTDFLKTIAPVASTPVAPVATAPVPQTTTPPAPVLTTMSSLASSVTNVAPVSPTPEVAILKPSTVTRKIGL